MTLAPLVDPSVRGVEGKAARINEGLCAAPGCLSLAQQRHHLWPKSYLRGQPTEWVSVEGETIPNSTGLCIRHHEWVTGILGGHRAHVRWNTDLHLLDWWEAVNGDWENRGPLRYQSLGMPEPEAARVRRTEGLCPSCGKPLRTHVKDKTAPKRKVKTWALSVPDDAEVGTDVLDVYIEDLGVLMGFDENARLLRYHVLVPVLEWVSQNKAEFLRDWEDA